jgi:hypothetical protein
MLPPVKKFLTAAEKVKLWLDDHHFSDVVQPVLGFGFATGFFFFATSNPGFLALFGHGAAATALNTFSIAVIPFIMWPLVGLMISAFIYDVCNIAHEILVHENVTPLLPVRSSELSRVLEERGLKAYKKVPHRSIWHRISAMKLASNPIAVTAVMMSLLLGAAINPAFVPAMFCVVFGLFFTIAMHDWKNLTKAQKFQTCVHFAGIGLVFSSLVLPHLIGLAAWPAAPVILFVGSASLFASFFANTPWSKLGEAISNFIHRIKGYDRLPSEEPMPTSGEEATAVRALPADPRTAEAMRNAIMEEVSEKGLYYARSSLFGAEAAAGGDGSDSFQGRGDLTERHDATMGH